MMRTLTALILLPLLLPAAGRTQTAPPATGQRTVPEKLICHYDPSTMAEAPVFSPDSRRVAYEAQVGEKWFVVVDGKDGKAYYGFAEGQKSSSIPPALFITSLLGSPQRG